MVSGDTDRPVRRLLVVIPNWAGDVVLATPVLAALRVHFREARIAYLLRPYVNEIVDGGDWHDTAVHWPSGGGLVRELRTLRMASRQGHSPAGLPGLWQTARRAHPRLRPGPAVLDPVPRPLCHAARAHTTVSSSCSPTFRR